MANFPNNTKIVVEFTLEKAHLSKKFPIVLSKETTTFVQEKSWAFFKCSKKSVESKARANFWQTDVKFGRK
jgi:hypothetical protein